MRILYVEDNETNQALVGRIMRIKQHSVLFRDEGEGALELLADDPDIDLVLLDIELAGTISGLEVIQTLRARQDMRPVVAVTAYAMMGDRERILQAGCDQYLPKPLIVTDLLAMLDHYEAELSQPKTAAPKVETVAQPESEPAKTEPAKPEAPKAEAEPAKTESEPAKAEAPKVESEPTKPDSDAPTDGVLQAPPLESVVQPLGESRSDAHPPHISNGKGGVT